LEKERAARFDSVFVPSSNFPEQSARMAEGTASDPYYLPSRYRNPDFSVLTEGQIAFYRFWKESFFEANHIRADVGYFNLLASEFLCSDLSPIKLKQQLLALYDFCSEDPLGKKDVSAAVFDLCISEDLTLPIIDYCGNPGMNEVAAAEAFSSPPSYVSAAFIRIFSPDFAADLTGAFNSAIHDLDQLLISEEGRGFAEVYGSGIRTFRRRLFADRPFMNGRTVVIEVPALDIGGRFGDAVRAVCDLVAGKKPKDGVLPAYFVPSGEPAEPEFRSSHVYRVRESPYGRMRMFFGSEPIPNGFRKEMEKHWEEYSNKPCEYIPSGTSRALYSGMDASQYAYFRYWKNEVREGRYPETDNGYVWLFANEQISDFRNRQEVYRRLCGMCQAYESTEHGLLHRLCFEYAVLFNLPVRFATTAHDESAAAVLMEAVRGGSAEVLPYCFITAADAPVPWARAFDDGCCRIACEALKEISRRLKIAGSSLEGIGGLKTSLRKIGIFGGTGIGHSLGPFAWADLPVIESDGRFEELLRFLISETSERVHRKKGNDRNKEGFILEGIDCGKIVEECISRRRSSGTVGSYERLDLDAIAKAENDLEEVTRIMSTEEETEEETPAETAPGSAEGWFGFFSSLTEEEGNYLRSALKGRPGHDGSVEDSINGKALDAIGDTVIEGGEIVEDYRSDLEEGL